MFRKNNMFNNNKSLFKNKKASGIGFWDPLENWAEIPALLLLIVGFIIALWSRSAVVTYIVIILCGIIAGRGIKVRQYVHKIAYTVVIIAFLIGFSLGSFYGKTKYILVLFIIGCYIGYVLHSKEWI